jgi:tubby and related proteins
MSSSRGEVPTAPLPAGETLRIDTDASLLRQYEQALTRSISPSSAATAAALARRASNLSPRAVAHSSRAFEDVPPPTLASFSPRRRKETSPNAIHLSVDDEHKEEEDASLPPSTVPRPAASTTASAADKEPSTPLDTGDGCLICMDEFSARRKAYPLPCTGSCTGAFVHYRCIMAWLGQSGSCPLCRGACDPLVLQPLQKLEIRDIGKVSLQPVPLDAGIIRCYVKQIYRGMFKQYGYELYLQGQIGTTEEDTFLLSSRRQVRSNMTANYTIHTDKDCSDEARIGRMGSNFLGTCFTMYDNGRDPQKLAKIQDAVNSDEVSQNVLQIREELGCVTYEPNRTSVGPRKMRVVVPQVDEEGVSSKVVRPMSRQDRLVTRLGGGDLRDLMKFTNREPVFREDLGAYCLDFGGRVSMASVKNFQLINSDDPSMGNILQFGRVADDMFTMDFQWPLSPFQAFCICLSSCDTKLACV